MNNDIEADFWKEIFRHLQHRNMSRLDASKLAFSDAESEVENFVKDHTGINFNVEKNAGFIIFEAPVTESVNIRLFIQNQIKGSLMQKNGSDWVKIADAKFYNNPFSEIELILKNSEKYKQDLASLKKETSSSNVKDRITLELVKAMMMKKWGVTEGMNIRFVDNNFSVTATISGQKKEALLSKQSFYKEIKLLN